MKRTILSLILLSLIWSISHSCMRSHETEGDAPAKDSATTILKKREDGTLSSANQVDDLGRVHGVRVTYFADGKTIYSKLSFKHGKKHGSSIKYYDNGQVYEHASFENGLKHGPTRKYYKNGKLMAEFSHENGVVLPGLKEYDKEGTLITSYPEVEFSLVSHLESHQRIDLEISCTKKYKGTKYFLLETENGVKHRTYLITDRGSALLNYYLRPGESLSKQVEIMAEFPTELGNVYAKKYTYQLNAKNEK